MSTLTTTTQIDGPVDVVFQQTLLRNAHALSPYFTGSTPGTIAENSGTFTVKWRRIENLTPTVTPLAELTGDISFPTRQAVQPSVNDLTAAVQKYGNFIILNEEVNLKNYNGQTDKLVELMGINSGQSLNRLQRNEVEDNSTQKFSGTATVDGNVIAALATTGADIDRVVNLLDRNSANRFTPMSNGSPNINTTPQRAAFWGLTHSDVEQDVREITGFVPIEQYAGQVGDVARGEFGSARGVRFVSTPEASIDADSGGASTTVRFTTASTNIDLYTTVIIGMDHHGSVGLGFEHVKETYNAGDDLPGVMMISKEKGSAGSGDPLNEVATLGWKSWHAAKVMTNSTTPTTGEWGFALRSGARIL